MRALKGGEICLSEMGQDQGARARGQVEVWAGVQVEEGLQETGPAQALEVIAFALPAA